MNQNDRAVRLNEAVKHLISAGMIDGKATTKSIATTMGRNSSNVSSALRGDKRYLNPKFVRDFCGTFKNIISEDWVLWGKGRMLKDENTDMANILSLTDKSLTDLSKDELIMLVKKLLNIQNQQTVIFQHLIKQNDDLIRTACEHVKLIDEIKQ